VAMRNRGANWRKMAEDARTIANGLHDAAAKQTMMEIARRYEALAASSESQAKNERTEGGGGLSEQKVDPGGHAYDHVEEYGSSTMSDNPPSRFDRKNRIREWAYYIWVAAGRPDGYDKDHWEQAEALIAKEDDQAPAEHSEGFGTQKSADS
jgi:hypothetical protein